MFYISVHHRVIILTGRKFGEQERRERVDRGTASREQLKFPGHFSSGQIQTSKSALATKLNFAQV